jgi:hypothetical protein
MPTPRETAVLGGAIARSSADEAWSPERYGNAGREAKKCYRAETADAPSSSRSHSSIAPIGQIFAFFYAIIPFIFGSVES